MIKKKISILFVVIVLFTIMPLNALASSTITHDTIGVNDHCVIWYNGTARQITLGGTLIQAGYHSSPVQRMESGLRFTNIDIPYGAVIYNAYLSFYSQQTNAGVTVNTTIQLQDDANPEAFTTSGEYISRARYPQSVEWNNIPAWSIGNTYQSPAITDLVQQAVVRLGWTSGNSIVLFWGDYAGKSSVTNGACRNAISYHGDNQHGVKLIIEYEGGSSVAGSYYSTVGLSEKISLLQDDLDEVKNSVNNIDVNIKANTDRMNDMEQGVEYVVGKIDKVGTGTSAGVSQQVVEAFNKHTVAVENLSTNVNAYNANVQKLSKELTDIKTTQTVLNGKIDAVNKTLAEEPLEMPSDNRMLIILALVLMGLNIFMNYLVLRKI